MSEQVIESNVNPFNLNFYCWLKTEIDVDVN